MKRKVFVLVLAIAIIVSFQVNGAKQSPVLTGDYVTGGEAWRPDSQMLIVPYIPTTRLIYKEQGVWKQKELVNGRTGKFYVWSNKGDRYAYWKNGKLYLASLTKKPLVIGKAEEMPPAWSPDDKYIAYVYNDDIWIVTIESMKLKKITRNPIDGASDLQWLSTGNEIFFTGINYNLTKRRYTIWKVDVKTGETTMINGQINCGYIITTCQDRVLFLDDNSEDFLLMDLDGRFVKLTNDGESKHFVYYNTNGIFYLRDLTFFQLNHDNITTLLKEVDYVSVAPNGSTIAYSVLDKFYIADNFIKISQ